MITQNIEDFPNELTLFPIQGKNIELSFSGGRISSDGGLLMLRELDSQTYYIQQVSAYVMKGIIVI